MFKTIRCGKGFGLVILVSPPDAKPDTPGARFWRYADWQIGDHEPDRFNEIDSAIAESYFSGHADGLGWEDRKSVV